MLADLDRIVEEIVRSEGAVPTYKGYQPAPSVLPFPGAICTAVNEEIVHGIPGPRRLRDGDIVGIDLGATLGGWVGYTCYTYPVGDVSPRAGNLLSVTRECLEAGISEVGPEVSHAVYPGSVLGEIMKSDACSLKTQPRFAGASHSTLEILDTSFGGA